jgi:hypothetical protein
MPPPRLLDMVRGQPRITRVPPRVRPIPDPAAENRAEWLAQVLDIANVRHRPPVPMDIDPPFDPAELGLKEIGNLASWTVSSCKPGCGVDALRDEDTSLFWQ